MPACQFEYEEERERILMDCTTCLFGPSLEDYPTCMALAIDKLIELKKLVRITLTEAREHEYDFPDAKLLLEIAFILDRIMREIVSLRNIIIKECENDSAPRYQFLQNLMNEMRYDPIEAYKNLLREIRHTKIHHNKEHGLKQQCIEHYILNTLLPIQRLMESCKLINIAKPMLVEHKNRSLYRKIFHPTIKPNFMYTHYMTLPPPNAILLERYQVGDSDVQIFKVPGKVRLMYHIIPPEFKLQGDEYTLLDTARQYIGRHEPRDIELADPQRVRENLLRIGMDMLRDLSKESRYNISEKRLNKLANILTRYTAGMGTLELLLEDENIQDVAINAPVGLSPIYIFHGTYQECETNLIPSREDAESWATRFRLQSGRPLDEANPVLDTELSVPGGRARVAAITRSLSPDGLGFALRRHRDSPWTFPLFISKKFMNPFAAALMWFLIDGSRTILVAGTRSSGKSSFLGSCMVQIMPKIRIITVEDTLELPVEQLKNLGYNIERLKSRSVITRVETELPAEEALRTALRLGDSSLIVGEVRSTEALALYEAMRIGALANVVAGTIHGDSAYGVFDRVVNDLKVPPTSFKATDIVVICNMLKSPDGLTSFRRILEITEVRKHWRNDPVEEVGFVNLLEYSAKEDTLKPTKTLLTSESVILNDIASRVREWKGNWDAVWNNIILREKILKTLVDYAKATNNMNILEAPAVIQSNSQYHIIASKVREEIGSSDSKMIFDGWYTWLKSTYKM